MTVPAYTQVAFRIRNDNGSETTATWRQAQNTNDTLTINTNYRIRFLIDETNNKNWSNIVWTLWFSKNSGTWTKAASGQPIKPATSANFTDGDATTSQLTGGSGTFLTTNAGMDSNNSITNTGAANQYWEAEYCFQIDSAYVANNDTIQLRVYDSDTTLDSYSQTPTITVSTATTHEGTATLAGTSTKTAVGKIIYNAISTLAGTSTETVAGINYRNSASTLNATSTFIAVAILYREFLATLNVTSTFAAIADVTSGTVTGTLDKEIVGISIDLDGKVLIKGNVSRRYT